MIKKIKIILKLGNNLTKLKIFPGTLVNKVKTINIEYMVIYLISQNILSLIIYLYHHNYLYNHLSIAL